VEIPEQANTEEDLQSRLQGLLTSAVQSGELQKAVEEIVPEKTEEQQEAISTRAATNVELEQKESEKAPVAPVESPQDAPPAKPVAVERTERSSGHYPMEFKPMPLIKQSAFLIVLAVVFHGIAFAMPWWEHKDDAGHKTRIGLWNVEVGGEERSWGKHCIGVVPPECDEGPRMTVTITLFLSLFFALVAAFSFLVAQDCRRPEAPNAAKRVTICGLASLVLSIILTIVCGASSMWYESNTKLSTPGLAFYFIWISAALMIGAAIIGAVGVCCDSGPPPAESEEANPAEDTV